MNNKSDTPKLNWYYVVDENGERQSVYFEDYDDAFDFLLDCDIEGDQVRQVLNDSL